MNIIDADDNGRPTLPDLSASNDTDRPPPPPSFGQLELPALVIPVGQAQHAFAAALDDLQRAFVLVEATGMALARQLDAQEETT
jgi:hypothetical protein